MKMLCELCKGKARLFCDADHASLCWDCDANVHSANFLVARHSRNLLCRVCQSPTRWSASGAKLGPTASVCEQCVDGRRGDDESDDEDSSSEGEEEEAVEENLVAPWSPPPPEAAEESSTSSIGEEAISDEEVLSRKRFRIVNACSNLQSDEDKISSSSQFNITPQPSYSALSTRKTTPPPQKLQRIESGRVEVCASGILDSLRRLHREETGPGGEMAEFCTLSGPSI